MPPIADLGESADAYACTPLLNCLLREAARPEAVVGEEGTVRRVHRLAGSGRLLGVRGTRRPTAPEVRAETGWRRLDHTELVKLVAEELRLHTGLTNDELPGEMLDSRNAVAALLAARAAAEPPADPYLRSEQSLLTGHPFHPAPKARGAGPAAAWLPYAPEAHARFPLTLLAVREDAVVEEGDVRALDALGEAPPGYRLLPAHPWQLDLVSGHPEVRRAFADGRLLRLGRTAESAWPTAAVRTLYLSGADLFLKFSLDVRITNDVRRLWRHDLLRLRRTDSAVTTALAALPAEEAAGAAWLSDRGYRTASFAFEELAVLVRDGLTAHLPPGSTPLLAAALAEGFDGSPLDRAGDDPLSWWRAYLRAVVPPAFHLFHRHGVVLEAHLQNCLIAVGPDGRPVRALFRDAEGVKTVPAEGTGGAEGVERAGGAEGVAGGAEGRAAGWERLVYCLLVNHLGEVAEALRERHPEVDPWPAVRREVARHDFPEARRLLTQPTVPGKTNLLLRWTGADGADARYLPLPNPLSATA
ncbi:IucA/IucC family protein [Streptomyces sp. NPDC002734]|uniref:IucA/IucC family protein n=1 Tax=Streptomyces sp. NPDC002734 TaxID=3154426 RepID=UPI0033234732